MKKSKLLISIASLSTLIAPIAMLSSCGDSTIANLKFSCSTGVELVGELSTTCDKGTTWWELNQAGKVPSADISHLLDPTDLGWYIIDSTGSYIKIENNYIIKGGETFRYIAFNADEKLISVNLTYDPDPTVEPYQAYSLKGSTFKAFREWYEIPDVPAVEGYVFKCFKHGNETITDTWIFPEKVTVNISIEYEPQQCKLDITAGDHGTISSVPSTAIYGTEWKDIKSQITVKPDDNYKLSKWVDADGNEISDYYVIKGDFTAKAVFEAKTYSIITFKHSGGVSFSPEILSSTVENGLTWKELKDAGKVPDALITGSYHSIGWLAIDGSGSFSAITDNTIITNNITAYYMACPQSWGIKVNLKYDSAKPAVETYAIAGGDFGTYRSTYGIPESISKQGYTFDGWYNGTTKLTDAWTFPTDGTTELTIEAKYLTIKYQLNLTTNGFGTISKDKIEVETGSKWGDVIKDVTCTPISEDYYFDKWADANGNEIPSDYEIHQAFTATAVFAEKKVEFTGLTDNMRRASFSQASHGDYQKLTYNETVKWDDLSAKRFLEPKLQDNELIFETDSMSSDFRFMTQIIKISIPVKAKSTRTTRLNISGTWEIECNSHLQGANLSNTIQVFKLNDTADHPEYYTNQIEEGVPLPTDPKAIFTKCCHINRQTMGGFTDTRKFNNDIIDYTDTNDTEHIAYFDHYISVSFLLEGRDKDKCAISTAKVKMTFKPMEVK